MRLRDIKDLIYIADLASWMAYALTRQHLLSRQQKPHIPFKFNRIKRRLEPLDWNSISIY